MEANLRQWKKATQIYDDALVDPFVSKCSLVYESYAKYCIERKKIPSAQKVYIKGLSIGLMQTDVDRLWDDFLDMMRQNGSPELSRMDLYEAISQQLEEGAAELSKPSAQTTNDSSFAQQANGASKLSTLPPVDEGKFDIASVCREYSSKNNGQLLQPLSDLLELESVDPFSVKEKVDFQPASYFVILTTSYSTFSFNVIIF
jgi:hypothetical protein